MDINTIVITIAVVAVAVLLFAMKDYFSEINIPTPWGNFGIKLRDKLDKNTYVFRNAGIPAQFEASDYTSSDTLSNIPNRDAVIDKLASLAQIIKFLARAKNIPFSESTDVLSVVDRLTASNFLSAELASAVRFLYGLGAEVRNKPKAKIDSVFSRKYVFFANAVIDVIDELLKSCTGEKKSSPRKTQVGGGIIGFARPDLGRPAATLYCLSGAFQGQRFPINKSFFKLGANADNDLIIPNDEYISGSHAHINYDQGSLLLFDDASRNGTFLNGERINSPRMLKLGDKIKLGGYTLELT